MPILKKSQAKRPVAASSLHQGNEEALTPDESGQDLLNHMSVDLLIDPEDDTGGSTHTSINAAPIAKPAKKAVKAAEVDPADAGTPVNPGTTNVGTIPNDVDPDQGYIGASDEGDEEEEGWDTELESPEPEAEDDDAELEEPEDEPEVASDTDLQNNNAVTPLSATDEEEWDDAPEDDESDIDEMAEDDEASGNGGVAIEDVQDEPEDVAAADEDLSILDIDETPDDQVDDVMFATAGTRLIAIKANRIIATMTGRMAINSGRSDVYLKPQFQEVTAMEMRSKGMRKGLKAMGFVLAKVNLKKQSIIQAQVKKEVTKTTAAVRKVQADNEAAFQQSLAIASVGINRQMFKGVENALKAHLAGEFRRLGISGANRILTHAFAEHGPAYAKSVIELAKKISAMPEEVRDGYVDALDMNNDTMDEADEDMVPIGAVEEDELDDEFGETVEASLARPGTAIKASTQVKAAVSGKYSVQANAILNGTQPLFF